MRWRGEQPFTRGDGPWRGTLVDQRGRAIPVSLHAESRAPHPAGALLSTLIVTGSPAGQNGGATFSIARQDDAGSVHAVARSEQGQESPGAPPPPPPAGRRERGPRDPRLPHTPRAGRRGRPVRARRRAAGRGRSRPF